MQAVVSDLSQVPEAFRSEYVERDGKFVLKLEGDHPSVSTAVGNANQTITDLRAKVDSFRENNVKLLKGIGAESLEDAVAKLEALRQVDPAEYKALKEKVEKLGNKGVKSEDDLAAIISREVGKVAEQLNARLDESEKKRVDAENAAASEKLRSTLSAAAVRAGVADSAVDDFLARGLQTFRVIDGNVTAVGPNGTPLFSEQKAGVPLSPDEYAAGLQKTAPHLFGESKGAGSRGSDSTPTPEKTVASEDFGDNIEDIANGKVTVPVPWDE